MDDGDKGEKERERSEGEEGETAFCFHWVSPLRWGALAGLTVI